MSSPKQTGIASVVFDKCTLCGACSNACPTHALAYAMIDEHVRLFFRDSDCAPSLCGSICVSLCPEDAISLGLPPQHKRAEAVLVAEDRLAKCKKCGLSYTPEKKRSRMKEMLLRKKANEATITALDYCPACRRANTLTHFSGTRGASELAKG